MSDRSMGESWEKRETIGTFLRDIAIVAVLCVAGFAWYKNKVDNDVAARELAREAAALIAKDNPADLKAAIKKLEESLAIRPKLGFALASMAETHALLYTEHKLGDAHKAEAQKYLALAEKHARNLPQTYSARALLMLGEGKAKEAEDFLVKNVLEKDAGDARIFGALAMAQRAQGKLPEAKRSGRAASDSDWRNPRFSRIVADIYAEENDAANALAFYGKALSSYSEHIASQLGKARFQIRRGQELEPSFQAIDRALREDLSPALRAIALTAKAEALLTEQKVDEALAMVQDAAKADGKYPWSYVVEAMIKASKQDLEGAGAAFDKAIEADPYLAQVYFDAAMLMASVGREDKAVQYMERFALKKNDKYYLTYGNVLRTLQKFDDAIAKYDQAIAENELNAGAYVAKAAILIAQNKLDEAQDALDRAVAANEFYPEAYVERGNLMFAKKEYEAGVQEFAMALSQWKQARASQEQLVAVVQGVKQKLLDARQREYANAWEKEAMNLIR